MELETKVALFCLAAIVLLMITIASCTAYSNKKCSETKIEAIKTGKIELIQAIDDCHIQ